MELGINGGSGVMVVTGGVWNVAQDANHSDPGYPGNTGGGCPIAIGSGSSWDGDAGGYGEVDITGGTVNAGGGITIGNVYGGGGTGLLNLNGGLLDLAVGGLNSNVNGIAGNIVIGSGGTLAVTSGTLQNVNEIYGNNATADGYGNITGTPMPLTMSGTGTQTLVLAGVNNYSGGTIINGGVLQLDGLNTYSGTNVIAVNAGALSGTGTANNSVVVASGAHLAPGDNVGSTHFAGTLTLGGLTLSSSANLDMNLSLSSPADFVAVNGQLDIESGATLNFQAVSGTLGAGSYPLMSYLSLGNNLDLSINLADVPAGLTPTISDSNDTLYLDLTSSVVTPTGPFTWTGTNGSAWDINTTVNWSSSGTASTYVDGYAVTFDDTAVTGLVSIAGTVQPTSITVSNSSLAYVFSGTGSIADNIAGPTTLTKSGNGSLEINMAGNTYSGGTFVTAGVLQVDASSAVDGSSGPLGTGPITLSGGTLQDNGSGVTLTNAVNITGDVTLASSGGTGSLTFAPQGLSTPNVVTITGAPTISIDAPVTIADSVSGNLVMAGSSTLTLTAASNNLTGTTQVSGGTLVGTAANIATPVALSNSANVTYNQAVPGTLSQVVSGNGSLTAAGIAVLAVTSSNTYTGATTINSGATLQIGSGGTAGSINGASGVTDNGTLAIDLSSSTTFSNNITGAGQLLKAGADVVILSGSNNYTGGTTVSEGTLEVTDPGALPTTGIINVGRSGVVSLLGLLVIPGAAPDDSLVSVDTVAEPTDTLVAATDPVVSGAAPPVVVASGSGVIGVSPADGFTAVPEPGTLALLLAGAAALAVAAWRRRRLGR